MQRYVIRGRDSGPDRLGLLADSDSGATSAFWDRAGLSAGARCLDLGCGPGAVTLAMARRVGPSGAVLAVDRDPAAVELATQRMTSAGVSNVSYRVADAYEYAAVEEFDFVYSRLLLHHLARPGEVLRRMWSAVRAGGVVAVDDADFDGAFCYPPDEGFDFWRDRYAQVVRHHGGDPTLGRKLVSLFVEAGLPPPDMQVTQRVLRDGPAKQVPMLTVQETAEAMIDAGIATRREVETAVAALAAFAADPTTIYAGPRHVEVWARKT
jgi:ubiquinone/menaquinone biosynthesis C-methylase UbiE